MIAIIAKTSGHLMYSNADDLMTDDEVFRGIEKRNPKFCRENWTVYRYTPPSTTNYELREWEPWLVCRLRRVVCEIADRHEIAFRNWLLDLGPLIPPDPPAPYRDPWATIEWEEPT